MPGEFLDTNILLYLTSSSPERAERVSKLLDRGQSVSVQVLNEFVYVSWRKFQRDWGEIFEAIDELTPLLTVYDLTAAMSRDALRLVVRYQLAWWDALIVAAALAADCDTLFSEDMHDGLVVDGRLTIRNPFAQSPR